MKSKINIDLLKGKRILHFLSPVRWDRNVFISEMDSNFQADLRMIRWLPECHHYIVVPEKNDIKLTDSNITLLKYPYPLNVVSNRTSFDAKAFSSIIKIREIDIDFIFLHQPELLGNIMTSLVDKRYGEIVNKFLFFHWIDCPAGRGSPALNHTYMRQLESINTATKVYFHSDVSIKYLESNFKNPKSVMINTDYIKSKTSYMPTSNAPFVKDEPFKLPDNKKIVVFNHRWKASTGISMFEEYMESLPKDYMVWVTDNDAPDKYHKQQLSRGQYSYLLKNSYCSVCFVDGYASWNLSVQDGIRLGKPVLVYRHPTIEKVIGEDYPYFFSNHKEFYELLANLPDTIDWKIEEHDKIWEDNLKTDMVECIRNTKSIPKTALEALYCIREGISYKKEIMNMVTPNIAYNSNNQYIRRWLLWNFCDDDPQSEYTRYTIKKDKEKEVDKILKGVSVEIRPLTVKETATYRKNSQKFFKI